MHMNGMSLLSSHKGYPKRITLGFVCVALAASMVSGLLLVDSFRSYRASIDVLVISKSAEGALESEAARDALLLLGGTPSFFYDINETTEISRIEFSRTGKTSLRAEVISDTPIDARDGALRASRELFSLVGRYYDIRNNIGVRSIGAPRVDGFIAHPVLLIVSGLASGILFSGAFFSIILSLARMAFSARKKECASVSEQVFFPENDKADHEPEESSRAFSPDAFVPKKMDAKFFSFEPSGIEREKDYAHFNRGPAPMNLPVALDESEPIPEFLSLESISTGEKSDSDDGGDIFPEIEPMIDDAPADESPLEREPTAEEYKRRLNDLLQGKMPK